MSGVWSSAGMNKTKPHREVTRTQFMRDSTHSGERWGSRRWTIGSRTSFGLSRVRVQRKRGRPQEPGLCLRNYFPSLIRAAAWGERCDGVQATCTLSAPGSADAGPARTPCSLGLSILGARAASRKSSDTASYEARTLLGASARSPIKKRRALPLVGPADVRAKLASVLDRRSSARSLEENFVAESGTAPTEAEYVEVLIGGGSGREEVQRRRIRTLVLRIVRTRSFAIVHDGSFPPIQSRWPIFFALCSSFSCKTEFKNLSARRSPLSVPVTLQGGVPMLADPRHLARCERHEARAGNVALISCCLVRLNGALGHPDEIALSSSACTQRSICHGAAPASRLDPLTLSGDKRGRSKALLFAVLNGTSIPDSDLVSCSCDPANWACRRSTSETSAKDITSARISFSSRAAILPVLDWLPRRVAHAFLQSKELRRVWLRLLILCCDSTTVACLCSQNATVQASLHTATFLSGTIQASGAFAVAEDEGSLETDVRWIAVRIGHS